MSCKNGCNYVEFESEVWLILANIVVIYSCSPAVEPAKRGARHKGSTGLCVVEKRGTRMLTGWALHSKGVRSSKKIDYDA